MPHLLRRLAIDATLKEAISKIDRELVEGAEVLTSARSQVMPIRMPEFIEPRYSLKEALAGIDNEPWRRQGKRRARRAR